MNLVSIAALLAGASLGVPRAASAAPKDAPVKPPSHEVDGDRARATDAFMKAYRVFMHPRCKNCHPAGDTPLQGEDSHVHDLLRLRRGPDGNGVFAMRCSNCHQAANGVGPHTPPGAPRLAAEGRPDSR